MVAVSHQLHICRVSDPPPRSAIPMLDQCLTNVIARTMALQAPAPGRARRFEDLNAGCGGMPGRRCGDA